MRVNPCHQEKTMATPTPITEGGGLSQPYRGKAMNEEKDKPEGEEKDLSETEWDEVSKSIDQAEKKMKEVEEMEKLSEGMEREVPIRDLTEAEVNKLCYDLLAQADAHMAEAKALRGSWDELTPEAKKQCWELQDSAMFQVKYAKKLLGQHHKVLQ
jgi:hypothetical protein